MRAQCCSLAWNTSKRDVFLSSSWDDTIKLWSLNSPASLRTFAGHTYCVYHVAWCVCGGWGVGEGGRVGGKGGVQGCLEKRYRMHWGEVACSSFTPYTVNQWGHFGGGSDMCVGAGGLGFRAHTIGPERPPRSPFAPSQTHPVRPILLPKLSLTPFFSLQPQTHTAPHRKHCPACSFPCAVQHPRTLSHVPTGTRSSRTCSCPRRATPRCGCGTCGSPRPHWCCRRTHTRWEACGRGMLYITSTACHHTVGC